MKTNLLLANHVEGDDETVMDTNQAVYAGVAAGALMGLFLLIGQLLFCRN
jgi:hypothetical protein